MGKNYLKLILWNFLSIEKNMKMFEKYTVSRDKCIMESLEKEFKKYYLKIVVVSYFSKTLYHAAQKFDKKIRKYQSFKRDLLEQKEGLYVENIDINDPNNIANLFADKNIYKAINKLTGRQKQILYLLYVKNMTEIEVASALDISQQAVNKGKNRALKEIKSRINTI